MDSHPHMVISHEFDLFNKLASGSLTPTKSEIFDGLWENTRESIIYDGLRAEATDSKGYILQLLMGYIKKGSYVDYSRNDPGESSQVVSCFDIYMKWSL